MSRPVQAGDLAIIMNGASEMARRNIDKHVLVLGPARPGHHHGVNFSANCDQPGIWFVQSLGSPLSASTNKGDIIQLAIAAISGAILHPIEHPGDNVTDESKAWLPPVPPRRQVKP